MAFRKSSGNAGKRAADFFKKSAPESGSGKSNHIFARLLRGELSLTIAFWTFFISIPLLGWMVFSQLIFPTLDPARNTSAIIMTLWIALAPTYMTLASLALWRTAKAYTKNPSLGQLARAAAILGFIGAIAYAVLLCGAWMMLEA